MNDVKTMPQAARSLRRLWPRLEQACATQAAEQPAAWEQFRIRLRREWERIFGLLHTLYGGHCDFCYHLEELAVAAARSALARPAWLRELDAMREQEPHWHQSQAAVGGVLYVDLFGGTLAGLRERIPYLRELGINYLHLMPLFASPAGNNDGGYAVSSYRAVNPVLGSMAELAGLARELHADGISLVLDFVFNHTSDEHEWARRARSGDPEYQDFYLVFPDRREPDAYQASLRQIFPAVRRGSFTYHAGMGRWVWTTFHSFQWDLNYANPAVFRAMAEEMLFLANTGAEVLRLDAAAFIWKRLGTTCENQPEAHLIIQAYNALARIAAPALLFKSEAIVHPDEVLRYVSPGECQLSYNPLLMALLWEAAATRDTRLLAHSLDQRFCLPEGCAWVNYLRCHDDIDWTFDDAAAARLGINACDHRQFLNAFYTGRFPGSFACGVPFQENPDTSDVRVCGTLASLAGLEQALQAGDPLLADLAVRRILLLHSIILSIGGIPLLYLGDEVATLNSYAYAREPDKAGDPRWVHRPAADPERAARRRDEAAPEGRVFTGLQRLIRLRQVHGALGGGDMAVVDPGNPHLLAYLRRNAGQRLLVVANFTGQEQAMDPGHLRVHGPGCRFTDVITGQDVDARAALRLAPYQFLWLRPEL